MRILSLCSKNICYILIITMIISACNIISLGSYATKHDTIYVSDSKIYKPDGSELIMKGVNTIDVYYLFQQNDYRRGKNIKALEKIAEKGVKSIRLTWNIVDDPQYKELTKAEKLNQLKVILSKCRSLNMTVILTLHYSHYVRMLQAQGKYKEDDENKTYPCMQDHVNYLVNDAKSILNDYKDMLLVNVVNEFGASKTSVQDWFDSHVYAIEKLRENGITNCLVISAPNMGQGIDPVISKGGEMIKKDTLNNTMFDVHGYYYPTFTGYLADPKQLEDKINQMRNAKLAFVFGEFAMKNNYNDSYYDVGKFMDTCNKMGIGYLAYCLYSMDSTQYKDYMAGNKSNTQDQANLSHTMTYDEGNSFRDWGDTYKNYKKTFFDYIKETPKREVVGSSSPMYPQSSYNTTNNTVPVYGSIGIATENGSKNDPVDNSQDTNMSGSMLESLIKSITNSIK